MSDLKTIKELALHAAKHTAPANFSVENVDEALRGELAELVGSINDYNRNKYDLFEIIMETADEIVPKKVIDAVGIFAEVQQVAQGQTAKFKRSVGKMRAKKFLTQVGLSGVYETFRLDKATFEVSAHAVGGAADIDFERMLDGAETMAEVMDIITEGLADAVFYEIHKALVAAANSNGKFPSQSGQQVSFAGFDAGKMLKIINVVKAYGGSAAIFATPEFVADMGPDAIVPPIVGVAQGIYSPDDIEAIHRLGRVQIFRGTPIVEIPQSFIDEDNVKTWINPQIAYVLPTGQEKVVKVVLEGQTQVYDFLNRDQSIEIHAYKKMGCAILAYNNWGVYQNTNIPNTYENPYGF